MAGQRVKNPGAGGNKFAARRAGRGFPLVSDSARTPRSSGGIPLLSARTPLKGFGAETRAETNFRPPSGEPPPRNRVIRVAPTAAEAQVRRGLAEIEDGLRGPDLLRASRVLVRLCRELLRLREADRELIAYARRAHAQRVAGGRKRAEQRWGKRAPRPTPPPGEAPP